MGDWETNIPHHWDMPNDSNNVQWNGPSADHADGNISNVAASFERDEANGFNDPASGDGARGARGCFNCGQEGHSKADCANPRIITCRHCNEVGHIVRDCPTAPPREFTGECRYCHEEGHMAKDCPTKPAKVCKNCQEEGHMIAECKNPRKLDRSHIDEIDADMAWAKIGEAAKEKDADDLQAALQQYVKACPDLTYVELEGAFRGQEIGIYLIAMENPAMSASFTHMDLQGNLDKKYRVHYRFDPKPNRPRERLLWPKNEKENLARLEDAGDAVNRGLSKCNNCQELGHTTKQCPHEKVDRDRLVIKCYLCTNPGHRIRDCKEPRHDKFACKNCGKDGHKAVDCPEPRVAGPDVECRKCGELGHFSRDCPQGGGRSGVAAGCHNCGNEGHMSRECPEPRKMRCRNCDKEGHKANECPEPKDMSKVQCRNCDEYGHESRGCPKPRDYSRVQCQACGEMGHTKVRCKKEEVAPDNFEKDAPLIDDSSNWEKEAAAEQGASNGGGGWESNWAGDVGSAAPSYW